LENYEWELWYYQPKTKPIGRSWHAAVVLEDRMIISGGYWWDGRNEHYCGDFWEFHFDSKEWNELFFSTPLSELPHARNRQSVIMSQGTCQTQPFTNGYLRVPYKPILTPWPFKHFFYV
jgi:hypothetical protein